MIQKCEVALLPENIIKNISSFSLPSKYDPEICHRTQSLWNTPSEVCSLFTLVTLLLVSYIYMYACMYVYIYIINIFFISMNVCNCDAT